MKTWPRGNRKIPTSQSKLGYGAWYNMRMSNLSNIELLAPAGGQAQLQAAINFGANAVYLAAEQFGMRAKAQNFKEENIKDAIALAHKNNVKVYVTCNILMHDADLQSLENFIKILADANADAVIVGDLGAMQLIKKLSPGLSLHISTQASVANTQAAIAYAKLGARRIVLAREMSLQQIKEMRKALDDAGFADTPDNPNALALEAFVHGAMCMSVSGRCLISSYLTGRSANKGACTQPCRWGYKLIEEKRDGQTFDIGEDNFGTYIMNSCDLNMLEHLEELKDAGVSSIKIEGRNKKALYVATVVNAYRHVLDGDDPAKWSPELQNVSHRPYSTGFYYGEAQQSPDYDGYEQNCVHVADVVSCEAQSKFLFFGKKYKTTVLCRNRFADGDTIEALIPGGQIQSVDVKDLKWYPSDKSGGKPETTANRAKETYSFVSNAELPAGTLLRSKDFLRTSRK